MSYRIIRLSGDYGMAIIASPENAGPVDLSNRFWLINDNKPEFETFKEVELNAVLGYFSGHADGMGFSELPDIIFEEIKDAEKWVLKNKIKFYEIRYRDTESQEELKLLLEELRKPLKKEEK
jgi:hypothetical protein